MRKINLLIIALELIVTMSANADECSVFSNMTPESIETAKNFAVSRVILATSHVKSTYVDNEIFEIRQLANRCIVNKAYADIHKNEELLINY